MSGAGVYEPFKALTPNDQGAAALIVAYCLLVTISAFSVVRLAVGRQRLLQFELDDATFGAAVVQTITNMPYNKRLISDAGTIDSNLSHGAFGRFGRVGSTPARSVQGAN
ncbi:MAG: hypothetical protein INR71_04770 [Terriglobus roseus]|nr:hypothetical protein [Terriglobus roseus]